MFAFAGEKRRANERRTSFKFVCSRVIFDVCVAVCAHAVDGGVDDFAVKYK